MALRLVLVGVVAGLGLSLPSGEQIRTWRVSAQNWVNTRLAAWDAEMPSDENAFILIEEPSAQVAEVVAPPVAGPSVLPAETSMALATDYADGLDAPSAPMALDASEPAPTVTETLDAAFLAAESETLSAFASEPADGAVTGALEVTRIDPVAVAKVLYKKLVSTVDRVSRGLAQATPPPVTFEPLVVGDDLYPGVAFALNREAEGLALIGREDSGVERGGDRLTHAVRLTRDAVYAWANVLHGPAVVTIAH